MLYCLCIEQTCNCCDANRPTTESNTLRINLLQRKNRLERRHSVAHQCLTVVRLTSQSYRDSKISGGGGGGQNPQTPELIDNKFSMGDYVDDDSLHAKTQNKKLCYCRGTARGTCQ